MDNQFSDLYDPNKIGAWMTHRQGLTAGMDLHDFICFARRACEVINLDPSPSARVRKAQRLLCKMRKVENRAWFLGKSYVQVRRIMAESARELEDWSYVD